jgi:EmrB/QacA subfamily drug resistance transporter
MLRVQRLRQRPVTRSPGWTLFVVSFATGLLLLNVSAPNVALPDIARDLGADFSDAQLILSAYALTLAALLLTAGTLADLHGRKRTFLAGIGVFAVGSLACGLAPDPAVLIGARAVQGIGAAVLLSGGLSLLAQEFQGPARARALGIWGATVAAAFAIGPLEGGLLTEGLSWRWLFLVNVVLSAPLALVAAQRLRESSDPGTKGVDWLGVATLSPALFAGVYALVRGNALGWTSTTILALFAVCAALLAVFVAIERRREEPMLDLDLFRVPTFTGSALVTLAMSISMFASFVYVTLYLLNVVGSSPTMAGLQLAPYAVMAFVASTLAGRLARRLPMRTTMATGLTLCAGGLLLMLGAGEDSSWLALLPGLLVAGLGTGLTNPFVTFASLGTVPTTRSGTAAGVNNTFRQLGIAGGIAALGALLQSTITSNLSERLAGTPAGDGRPGAIADRVGGGDLPGALASLPAGARGALETAYQHAFVVALHELLLISAGLALLGALLALALVRQHDLIALAPEPAA